jgi:hypothetical protein
MGGILFLIFWVVGYFISARILGWLFSRNDQTFETLGPATAKQLGGSNADGCTLFMINAGVGLAIGLIMAMVIVPIFDSGTDSACGCSDNDIVSLQRSMSISRKAAEELCCSWKKE